MADLPRAGETTRSNGFFVIDADRHVVEPSDLWDRYLEPEYSGLGVIGAQQRHKSTSE